METCSRLAMAAALLSTSACIRWGIPDEDGLAEDTDTDSTTSETNDSGEADSTDTGPEPWPESWPFSSESRLVVWGKSGVPTTNLAMLSNIYYHLAGVAPGEGPLTILWVADCDPRIDAAGCLAGNVQPFFDMVDVVGTIEFKPLAAVDPTAYDVIVVDFCEVVEGESIATLLAEGAGVLALGDPFCTTPAGTSAALANATLGHFGVRFVEHEVYAHDFTVPIEAQVGLLAGVTSLDAWGVALHETIDPVVVLLTTLDGAVLSERSEP
ncbi:hypothetical protein ACNOYE_22240 [Nannocystaceae bacterium ST9]